MRYPGEVILDLLGAGMSFADILADYPDLEKEDLQACLLFAGKLVKVNSILALFEQNFETIIQLFDSYPVVGINNSFVIGHKFD